MEIIMNMPSPSKTNKTNPFKGGITFIELIVVLAAILIVVAAAPKIYSTFAIKARDMRRNSHIEQLQSSLQVFYLHNNRYPIVPLTEKVNGKDKMTKDLKESFLLLETRLPNDPASPKYDYLYQSTEDGKNYEITYCLEGDADPLTKVANCDHKAYPLPLPLAQ